MLDTSNNLNAIELVFRVGEPSLEQLRQLAELFGCDVEGLTTTAHKPPLPPGAPPGLSEGLEAYRARAAAEKEQPTA